MEGFHLIACVLHGSLKICFCFLSHPFFDGLRQPEIAEDILVKGWGQKCILWFDIIMNEFQSMKFSDALL